MKCCAKRFCRNGFHSLRACASKPGQKQVVLTNLNETGLQGSFLRTLSEKEGATMSGITLSELLKKMIEMGGSDLHITTNSPPQVRVDGLLKPLDYPEMTPAETKQLAYSVLTDAQKHRFEETLELDFSFGIKGLSRFRANIFNQRGAVGAVFRAIPYEIRSFDQLGLPGVVEGLCAKPRGLILVTGPTG